MGELLLTPPALYPIIHSYLTLVLIAIRPDVNSPTVNPNGSLQKYPEKNKNKVPLVEFMYLVFTRMPGESYRRRLRYFLLCLCDVFRAMITSLVCYLARLGCLDGGVVASTRESVTAPSYLSGYL